MADYDPLDLTAWCNADAAILGTARPPALGRQTFHGLPFQIGRPEAASTAAAFLAFGEGGYAAPLTIPIGRAARRVIVAHRLLDSTLYEGGPVGTIVADYTLLLASGERVGVPVRERFEIVALSIPWGGHTFNAVYDRQDGTLPRHSGPWGAAGYGQTEVEQANPRDYVLFTWENPQPGQAIAALEIAPRGPRFIVAAITLGHLDEHPFNRAGARPVAIALPRPADRDRPFDLTVTVDRGIATYPYALPTATPEAFLADGFAGFGRAQHAASSPAYVEIAAIPSATVTVSQGDEILGQARWGELEARGSLAPTPRLRLEIVDPGRNWVHTTVIDDETGKPVPCRVHFRSPEGIPYQPHGHHGHVNSNLDTWHIDVGRSPTPTPTAPARAGCRAAR